MEGKKKKAPSSSPSSSSSSSSLTSELFGSRENPSSSPSSHSGVFGSIFAPPSKALGRESMRQQETVTGGWNDKTSKTGDVDGNRKQEENDGSVYEEQRVQPCHLSSSIYYGGPDVYFQPQNSSIHSTKKTDGGEDDSGSASRGNWWQGSLYY
uniref:Uncharacterized protein n=1 Tax=Noccaea caerulescens TaxID=107243 RepID=A0A1J3H8F9_NOCCA